MKIVLSSNPFRDKGLKAAQTAARILTESGVDSVYCLPFALEGNTADLPGNLTFRDLRTELKSADLLICFGGDGTILHAAKHASSHQVPILGVNMGSVGFMANLEYSELPLLSRLREGGYRIETRMMLDVSVVREGKQIYRDRALNDAVVTKGAIARVIDLKVSADGTPIAGFSADGIIVSSPTGSTAYSMSAGGPIVEPTADTIIVTPICPHTLDLRPFVLGGERKLTVGMGKNSRKAAYLSVDGGKAFKLMPGDSVAVSRSSVRTRLVQLSGRNFYEVVNQKFGGKER